MDLTTHIEGHTLNLLSANWQFQLSHPSPSVFYTYLLVFLYLLNTDFILLLSKQIMFYFLTYFCTSSNL